MQKCKLKKEILEKLNFQKDCQIETFDTKRRTALEYKTITFIDAKKLTLN